MSTTCCFNNTASTYNARNQKLALIKDCLHQLIHVAFLDLSENSHILCVGAGTGTELLYLAKTFPNYTFTVLEPSKAMLDICKEHIREAGFINRCTFHNGYLETLTNTRPYNGATSILVSQFILDKQARCNFFKQIYEKLYNNGTLISADLSADISSSSYQKLLNNWVKLTNNYESSNDLALKLQEAYSKSVSVLPPYKIQEIIEDAGFKEVTLFFQSLLIHSWFAKK